MFTGIIEKIGKVESLTKTKYRINYVLILIVLIRHYVFVLMGFA